MAGAAPLKGNAALPDVQGIYIYSYSSGGRLDLLGWRALEYVRHYAESMRMMQAARREIGVSVCAFASSDRKIGHTVRITCVCVC